jgi:hypothetical protein
MDPICDRCGGCHDPRCPLGGRREPGCAGLLLYVVIDGVTYCRECEQELESGGAAPFA